MSVFSRRDFLRTSAILAGATFVPWKFGLPHRAPDPGNQGYLILLPTSERTADGKKSILSLLNTSSGQLRELSLPMEAPHYALSRPEEPSRVLLISEMGQKSCDLHLPSGEYFSWPASAGRFFCGHAAISPDGKLLYTAESNSQGRGLVIVRDAITKREIGALVPKGKGHFLHDVKIIRQGEVIALCCREPSSIQFFEASSGKFLEKTTDEPIFSYEHLNELPTGELLVTTKRFAEETRSTQLSASYQESEYSDYLPAPILIAALGKPGVEAFAVLAQNRGQALSAIDPDSRRIAAIFKEGGFLGIWDGYSRELLKEIKFPRDKPTTLAITPDHRYFVALTSGHQLHFIDTVTLELCSSALSGSLLRQSIHMAIFPV